VATAGRPSETEDGPGRTRSGTTSPPERLKTVWLALPRERRLAAAAALALIFTLFLPWYQETVIVQGTAAHLSSVSESLTGWGAFSFVEAAVLLVAAAVVVLLFVRAEGAAFHVPGGDGGVVTAAGGWTCVLIVWRMFDKEGTTGHGLYETTSGIEWGIFIALGVGALLTYAGSRIKLANEPEPPLPGESADARPRSRRASPAAATTPARPRRVRPSSLAAPRTVDAPRPSRPAGAGEPTQVRSASPEGERRPRTRARRPHRGLDFAELDQIELDEPPEAPTIRRRDPDPDDPLTLRLKRPD
jgi:hypothetical protein